MNKAVQAVSVDDAYKMLEPAGHRIIVRPDKIEEKVGSLYITEQAKDMEVRAASMGVIVAKGKSAWKAFDDGEPWASVGDRVMFATYAGRDVPKALAYRVAPTADRLVVLNDEDILMIVREEK